MLWLKILVTSECETYASRIPGLKGSRSGAEELEVAGPGGGG